jgi:deazaflavin-dependent oxidoreductase (nitroreductase family)
MTDTAWRPGSPVNWEKPGELWTAGGLHSFVLETTGAKSGETRRAVVGYLEEPNGWLVIASKGGAPTNPAWAHNLMANPHATVVLADGRRVAVRAERISGEDERRAWQRIEVDAPEFPKYKAKTSRHIPIFRLTRAASA